MLPLLPFVAGIATGAVALKLLRNEKTKIALDKTQEKLLSATVGIREKVRNATSSGLEAIETSSAAMRGKLDQEQPVVSKPRVARKSASPAAKKTTRRPAASKTRRAAKAAQPTTEEAS